MTPHQQFRTRAPRTIPLGLSCFGFLIILLTGCSGNANLEGYDQSLSYPLRNDPIVLTVPQQTPLRPPTPGTMEQSILTLPQQGGRLLDPNSLEESEKRDLAEGLDVQFGKPAAPRVRGLTAELSAKLGLDPEALRRGSALYKVRCADCHGLPGNGRGPSAAWNYPYARDFRSGVFKFTSGKANNGKPRIEDIARLLRRGIPGTPMPIFDLLSDEDVRALAGYTIFLSLRGEVELQILKLHFSGEDVPFENLPEALATSQARILQQWESAQVPAEPIAMNVDEADAEAIRRGHLLFAASASGSGCLSCHTRYGKDDSYRYDIWGLPARVGNLTEPTYKWGREPNDLALRIKHGILPVGMPANSLMTNQQIQDLVTFLRVLPYPARLPDDVRRAVEAPASGISK